MSDVVGEVRALLGRTAFWDDDRRLLRGLLAEVDRLRSAIDAHRESFDGDFTLAEEGGTDADRRLWAVLDGVEVDR
jgi:hypothetical protein